MTAGRVIVLVVAGVGGGLSGSVAGLASLVTYPALLALGLAPVAANVTNSVALVFSSVGAVSSSRPELTGQRARAGRLAAAGVLGGALGGVVLLITPDGSFEMVVPGLIAIAAVAILMRRRLLVADPGHAPAPPGLRLLLATAVIGVYGGYFGAGAGVMLMALFLHALSDSVPRTNALKNVVLGLTNGVAAVGFMIFGPVVWSAVLPVGVGAFAGARLGPMIVRRVDGDRLRVVVGIAGLGLAVKLGWSAYR